MKRVLGWFAENHVAANLLMFFFLVAGLISILKIRVEVFPDAVPDEILITVSYPGASPSEVEEGVIRIIEERVSGLAGVERVLSTAREGSAEIVLEVVKGWNTDELLQDVKSEVDRITNLPEEAERPIVQKVIRRYPVVSLAVYGSAPEKILKKIAEKLQDELTALPEITEVRLYATRPEEIHVEIPAQKLRKYGLTLQKVADLIRRSAFDLPAGRLKTEREEVLLRAKGRRLHARDFRNILVLAKPDGSHLSLGDIARLKDGFRDDRDLAGYFRGKKAVIVQVFRVGNQNDFRISKAVTSYVRSFCQRLPHGVSVAVYFDTSQILRARLHLLLKNLSIGVVFVVILLGLFLNLKLAFWVTLGIPVAFASALWLLPEFGVSINMISLFAFILVLGIVVDDAIVIGEEIFRRREQGTPPLQAAVDGVTEMSRPVIFAVLTTIAAFYPLLLGTGVIGKVIRHIPIVVMLVLAGSLIEALLVLPAHLARSKFDPTGQREKFVPRLLHKFVHGPFVRLLRLALKWRYATVAAFMTMLLLTFGLWLGGRLKFTFFPKVEADDLNCYITMPAGTPAERTLAVAKRIEQAAREVIAEEDAKRPGKPSLFKNSLTMLGVQMVTHGPRAGVSDIGSNLAQVTIRLLPAEKREGISALDLVSKWRRKVGPVPEAESVIFQSELFSMGKAIEVNLSLDNEKKLLQAVKELEKTLRSYPGVFDVRDNFLPGKEEIQIRLKPAAQELGLTLHDVATFVRQAFYGAEALSFQRGRDEVRVLVRYPAEERHSLGSLYDMWVKTPSGLWVPLQEVARLQRARGYVALHRVDLKRVITVMADVNEKISNASAIRAELLHEVLPKLREKYPGLFYSMEGEGKEHKKAFEDVGRAFFLALFLIYALLAVPLCSFWQPLVIMSAIPFGIVGAFLGHLLLGKNLSILSMFGIVGLAGVVVNDALILVDAVNRLRAAPSEITPTEAVIQAAVRRFRPIILTTLTTFGGLMPMIAEKSLQAQFLIPMAISLGFGVFFATLITLFLVPCGYLILEDLAKLRQRVKDRQSA